MADPLYLSLWFASSEADDMLPQALAVMRQFPFSTTQAGITYIALHPVSWNEATVLERRFSPPMSPEAAVLIASEILHADYAYIFEAFWDLWIAEEAEPQWRLQPARVRFRVHGAEFEDGLYQQEGNVEVDLGLDTSFLPENATLTDEGESRIRANVQKLVEFTNNVERKSGATGRLLWSESDENLAQKLIARLQRVQ